jgi:N-acylglucosamine 2-epimerase
MTKQRIDDLIAIYRDGFLKDTLPFWMKNSPDREHGGFYNYLDRKGEVFGRDKSVWFQGRMTWLLAFTYNNFDKNPELIELAAKGIDFLEKHCFDSDGRMFFEVTEDGRALRKRRYTFSETFGAMAFLEFSKATGDERLKDRANELFKLLIRYRNNPDLLPPKYFPEARSTKGHSATMILLNLAQQMRPARNDDLCDTTITAVIDDLFRNFVHEDERALFETVGPKGERLDSPEGRCVNPGHAIETAWFIMEEYRHRKDPLLLATALKILDWSLERGWDEEYGGILYFIDIEGKPPVQYEHDMKLWWPHTEAIYACLLAYRLTGDAKYEAWHRKIHEYTYSHFPDPQYGDWIKYLHRDGSISSYAKGNLWAGCFHVSRMQLLSWRLLEEMKR